MKRLVIVIFIIFGAFLTFSLYRTFAYDTSIVEETPSTTDLEYTFKIGNSSIKQITIDSGETKYYDVVLGNPNPAKINYGVYYEMVNPSTKPAGFSIEYTSKSTGESTGKIDKESTITLNLVLTNTSSSSVTVKLGTVAGYVNGGELALESGQEFIPKKSFPKETELVESLNDNSTGDSGSGVYKIHHDAISAESSATGEIISVTDDYRYYGASPNNYICLDMEGGSTCPDRGLFRIIGSIYEENAGKNLIKVIKATSLTYGTTAGFSWDFEEINGKEVYSNVWSSVMTGTSNGSKLMQLLNGIYLNRGEYSYNNYQIIITLDFTDVGLTDSVQKLMNKGNDNEIGSRYYLGGDTTIKTIESIYLSERGNTTSKGNSLYWNGDIGLMYPSDYGYVSGINCATNSNWDDKYDSCKLKNWIYNSNVKQWTMTPFSSTFKEVVIIAEGGNLSSFYTSYTSPSTFPVFYLSKDVVITSGTGTEQDPYLVQ